MTQTILFCSCSVFVLATFALAFYPDIEVLIFLWKISGTASVAMFLCFGTATILVPSLVNLATAFSSSATEN